MRMSFLSVAMLHRPDVDPVMVRLSIDPFDDDDCPLEIDGHDQTVAVTLDVKHDAVGYHNAGFAQGRRDSVAPTTDSA